MKLRSKGLIIFIFLLASLTSLYAQETETTTITIKNARQTTYEKSKKNSSDEDEGQDTIVLEGNVEISVAKGSTVSEIKADKITYDRKTEMLYAEGGVEILTKSSSAGGETTTATSLLMNTSTLEGIFDDGRVIQTKSDALNLPSGSTLIVFSDIFGKSENNTIAFKNSSLTFCDAEDPHWHIDASRTWLLPGGEFAFLNALLYVGPVPVMYFPVFYYPKDELIYNPVFGSKIREGKYVQTTLYLKGRKPLNSNNSNNSSSSSSSTTSTESSTEESLKAVYNFMKPTELKQQERQGLMLHNLDESYKGDTSTYVKVLADWYANLGGMVGVEANLRPSREYITSLNYNVLLGFSNTVFQNGFDYSALSRSGNMYYDKSNFLGLKLPFRYGANLNFILSKPFTLKVSLPVYSDPYFQGDFNSREESMDWISYLIDLSNSDQLNNQQVSTSQVGKLVWQLESSYSPTLPAVVKPYINTVSLKLNSSIYIESLQKADSILIQDSRYQKDSEWKNYTPERSFYYPSQVTPADFSVSLNGTLFQWPQNKTSSNSQKIKYPVELNKPDEFKTEQTDNEKKEEPEEENETPKLPEPVLPELNNPSTSVAKIAGLSYKLDYTFNSNLKTQIFYNPKEKENSTQTYLNTPEDFKWDKIQSSMYTIKAPVSLTSVLGYGGNFFTMRNALSFDPVWQGHPNTDGYTDAKAKDLKKTDYSAQVRNLVNTNSITFMPFTYIPTFSETGITWNNTIKIFRRKFTGNADNPQWETQWLDFTDPESVTANSISLTLGMKELDSKFKQTFTFSSTLKPLTAKYTGNLNLVFPYVTFSLGTGVYEKSKDDSTLQYNPLQQSLNVNLFNSILKFSESFSYVYNDNTDKKDKYPENLRLTLSYKQLSISFTSSYTYKYDLYIDTPNENGEKGYIQRSEKEFTPTTASLSYILPNKTHYAWYNRINWTPGLSTNINYDFIKPTNSYFQVLPSLTFNINEFMKLTFSATIRNSTIYWYFKDSGKYASDSYYGDNFVSRIFADLFQSTGLYGVNGWCFEDGAFNENRKASGFKLKSLNMTFTHELHDWDFKMTVKFEPKIVKINNVSKYVYDPYVSIGIVWNPMQSIKTNLTHEYNEANDEALWVLK